MLRESGKKVVRKLSEIGQKVVGNWSESCQKLVRKWSVKLVRKRSEMVRKYQNGQNKVKRIE